MSDWAKHEREALADAMVAAGPDAPTLCGDWTVADLAAHVYVRERRPDAAPGVLPLGPLSRYTDRVMASALRTLGFEEIVRRFRVVPLHLRLGPLDEMFNTVEFFVHTEDVLRAAPGWTPRDLPDGLQRALWRRLSRQARMSFRRVGARLRLVTPDGDQVEVGTGELLVVRGLPSDLTLLAFNRKDVARVDLDGPAAAVDRLHAARLGI